MNGLPAIPDHTLLRPIGRGAYGEVWLARNVMGVLRAVKVVERRQFDSARPYEREITGIQQYEPVSRMADGLVHVLHVGRSDAEEYFYYVMELADDGARQGSDSKSQTPTLKDSPSSGLPITPRNFEPRALDSYSPRTLRSDLKRLHRLTIPDCLRVALDVVSGLATLHEHGLVHRDVKPGNIIFVNARAKLADIGLVSMHGEGRTFVGTEGYIPPEGPGSVVADIYALGMALYESSTGYSPEEFPKVPAEWFAEEAGTEAIEFHEIVLKACEGAKERRYQSAEQMQADLTLLQSGQSVRRVRLLEKRATRTQRIAWVAGIVVTLALVTALIANWRANEAEMMRQRESALRHEAQDARAKESNARARAEGAEREARQQLNAALFEQARALVLSKELGHRAHSLDALRRAVGVTNAPELRRIAFAALTLPDLHLQREIIIDPTLTLIQPDPAFERIALCRGQGPVTIHSLPNLEILATLPARTNRDAYLSPWSPDGRFIAIKRHHDASGQRAEWEVWNVGQTQRVLTTGPDVAHNSVTFHPRRPLMMAGHGGGRVVEWNLEDGRQLRTFQFPNTPHALAYSPDGQQLAASYRLGSNWVIAFHNATNLDVLRTVDYPEATEFVAWHPQGHWFIGSNANASEWARGVRLINPDDGSITTLGQHKIKTATMEFTGDGDYLVTGGWDREIICWDLRTMKRAFTYAGTGYRHFWSKDGRRCAISLPSGVLQFFDFVRPSHRNLIGNSRDVLQEARFSPDGRWLAARDNRDLCVWDLHSSGPAARVAMLPGSTPFFSPDSTELFAGPDGFLHQGFLGRWLLIPNVDANEPPELKPAPVPFPKGLTRANLVSNELLLTSSEGVRFVSLTNLAAGASRTVGIPAGIGHVSPDARWLAMIYDYSPTIGVYRLPGMENVVRLQTSNLVGFVTFSPSGDEMMVLNRSGAEWFDTTTWQCTRGQSGAGVSGSYAFYTPDGNGIWMVTHFRNAALFNRHTLEPILPLPNDIIPLAVSPDGNQLVVSAEGRRVQLWDQRTLHQEMSKLGLDW